MNTQVARGYTAFFWGLLLADFLNSVSLTTRLKGVCCALLIIIPFLIRYATDIMDNVNYLLTFIYYPALIIVFKARFIKRIFNHKWIGTLGAISFDVYIWHNPLFLLMYIILKVFHLDLNLFSMKAMFVYTAISFAIGTISYYFIEQPMKRLINKKIKKLSFGRIEEKR